MSVHSVQTEGMDVGGWAEKIKMITFFPYLLIMFTEQILCLFETHQICNPWSVWILSSYLTYIIVHLVSLP